MARRSSFFIFFLTFLMGTLFSMSPSIFVDKTFIDLGYMKPHSKKAFKFKIFNSGEAPLIIKSIVHTCGCTSLKYDKKVIEPDGSMVVSGELRTRGERGPIIKYIYITSNDPVRKRVEVRVKAYVRAEVEATPYILKYTYPFKLPLKDEVLINFYGKGKFNILKTYDSGRLFDISLKRRDEKSFHLYLSTSKKISRDLTDTIFIETNSKEIPLLKIPVYFEKKEYFTIFPSYISLGVIGKPVRKRIVLRVKNGAKSIDVLKIHKKDWFSYKILNNNSKMVVVELKIFPSKFKKIQDFIKLDTNLGSKRVNISCFYNGKK